MRKMQKGLISVLETGLIGAIGAVLFSLLHMPLPWMLGALTSVMVSRLGIRRTLAWPSSFRHIALAILGFMLGSSFYSVNLRQMAAQLPYMAASTVFILSVAFVTGYLLYRKLNLSPMNAVFGCMPGGLNHIIALSGESKQIDLTTVVLMQTIRVLTVTFIVPFIALHTLTGSGGSGNHYSFPGEGSASLFSFLLFAVVAAAGFFVGKRIRLPGSSLTGPLLATSIVVLCGATPPRVPDTAVLLTQLSIGIHLGLQMKPDFLKDMRRLGIYTAASNVIVVLCCLGCALLLWWVTPIDLTTAFLSTSPGGIAEMGVTAAVARADLSVVSAYQLFRLFFIFFVVIPAVQWYFTRQDQKKGMTANKVRGTDPQ
ncbi:MULTISPECIES: AbrB family transcriptional regulator [Paenibacillus]|uniref:AbrB family transcriptional regulator n=1 Tax=Paenibacillus TaxID=44249 RepID=UPI00088A4E79|nr:MULTISPECIES: AbrB family transcriptional regulator [Paenibacillus]GCL72127.1 hypothetical protein PN4B1_20320 [Paenibacillus naphthalenovorans]SDI98979.1 hypothetical protein SAMN05421868_11483 [Paenibacillus naphthalenovorans]